MKSQLSRLKRPATVLAMSAVAAVGLAASPAPAFASGSGSPQYVVVGKGTTQALAVERAIDKADATCDWSMVRMETDYVNGRWEATLIFTC